MIFEVLKLIGAMLVILVGCELFANSVEHIGRKFALSHAATGSLLAAVGTALPETIMPILALVFGGEHGEDIGIGAIVGAPFMLLTLALSLVAVTVLFMKLTNRRKTTTLNVNAKAIDFDLKFFIVAFTFVIAGSLLYNHFQLSAIKYALAAFLALLYLYYIKVTLGHDAEDHETYTEFLYLAKYFYARPTITNVYLQAVIGLLVIIFGAKLFIGYLIVVGAKIGIPMLVLSLLITPIATELPEKYNSVTWTLKKKDTLAFGNIMGAVSFQSTLVVSVGLLLTQWNLDTHTLISMGFALISGILIFATLKVKGRLYAEPLLASLVLYLVYVGLTLGFL
ncbi:MAG: hypothetical protein MSIBF_04080 [Candidatus Altiarchaeales archaeon IMC4]|nr:MAG: hypothetical protein MSIBF_04080 [Candidatus Altiarchaeales archaeon IMC4]